MLIEAKIIEFLQSNASVGWIAFFKNFTMLASVLGLVVFAIIIFCKDKKLSLWFILTFGFVALFNLCIKYIFKRARPFDSYDFIYNFGNESGYSMPSSHSAIAGMISVFICYLAFKYSKSITVRVLTIIVMVLFTAMICLSRMILGVHYLTDTIAGVAEGVLIGLASLKSYIELSKVFKNKPTE